MHVRAAHQGSEPVVNQEESNGILPPCVHCQESDNGSLSSPRFVLDLMVLSISSSAKLSTLAKLSNSINDVIHMIYGQRNYTRYFIDQLPLAVILFPRLFLRLSFLPSFMQPIYFIFFRSVSYFNVRNSIVCGVFTPGQVVLKMKSLFRVTCSSFEGRA